MTASTRLTPKLKKTVAKAGKLIQFFSLKSVNVCLKKNEMKRNFMNTWVCRVEGEFNELPGTETIVFFDKNIDSILKQLHDSIKKHKDFRIISIKIEEHKNA